MDARSNLLPSKKEYGRSFFQKGNRFRGFNFSKEKNDPPVYNVKKNCILVILLAFKLGKLGNLDCLRVIRTYANIRIF